jgi:hypothetical protein
MAAQIINTKTNKPIADQTKAYYFLINDVKMIDGRLNAKLLGTEVLEDLDSIKEIIPKYLPLKEDEELCIYTCDERYIHHFKFEDHPSIEDVLSYIKF